MPLRKGLWLVFLGPDGCGKSSVIDALATNPPEGFSQVVCFHLRPYIIVRSRSSKNINAVVDPHGCPPRGKLSSMLKLFFFCIDYQLGFWTRVRKHVKQGQLVIFDRFYHDLLADPKRYRYGGPMWLARLIGNLIPQPDLFILLDAPATVLQSRKQEVPFDETVRQRAAYLQFMRSQKNGVVVDASQPLDKVVATCSKEILDVMARRVKKRCKQLAVDS